MQTEALTLPGFLHDTFSAVYPAAAASPVFARMPLAEHGLAWVHPGACSAHPLLGGDAVVLHRDLAATAASLDRQHAGDGDRWVSFVQPYLEAFDAVRDTMLTGFPPLRGPLALLRRAGAGPVFELARLLPGSVERFGRRLFEGAGSRAWLTSAALHGDTPPDGAGSAIAALYLNLLGHAVGWPSPRAGAGRLTDALVGHLGSLGGELRTGARVTRVLARGGRVSGVAVADGDTFDAAIVIADVMPAALAELAGDALARWYRAALGRYRYGPATIKLDWALAGPIPWSDPAVRDAGTVHLDGAFTVRGPIE